MEKFVWLKLIFLLMVAPGILKAAEVPFHLVHNLIIVQAEFDHKKGNFILDTGADNLILHEQVSTTKEMASLYTLDGICTGYQKKIHRFAFGNNTFRNLAAVATDLSTISDYVDTPIDGIIGAGMLKNSSILIDFEQKEIRFLSAEINLSGFNFRHQISFKMIDGVPVSKVKIGHKKYNFILDSGATVHLIDSKIVSSARECFTPLKTCIKLQTVDGQPKNSFHLYESAEISLGSTKIENVQCAAIDFSGFQSESHIPFNGVISISRLAENKQLVIDFENGVISF